MHVAVVAALAIQGGKQHMHGFQSLYMELAQCHFQHPKSAGKAWIQGRSEEVRSVIQSPQGLALKALHYLFMSLKVARKVLSRKERKISLSSSSSSSSQTHTLFIGQALF